jgi:predicted small integral membrane protein
MQGTPRIDPGVPPGREVRMGARRLGTGRRSTAIWLAIGLVSAALIAWRLLGVMGRERSIALGISAVRALELGQSRWMRSPSDRRS